MDSANNHMDIKTYIKKFICLIKGHDWDKNLGYPRYFEQCARCGQGHEWAA